MSRQYFEDAPYADPAIASGSAIVATTETALWNVAQFTPIPANDARAGKVYELTASGIYSTSATGSLTLTPRFGTTIGGVLLGASQSQTVPASITNEQWFMKAIMTVRSVGAPGANSVVVLGGTFAGGGIAATGNSSLVLGFGGTVGTVDLSAAGGIWIGWTLSVAGSVTVMQTVWQSIN